MGMESINKDVRGLGIIFSKMWSENIPVFSYRIPGVIHPEGAASYPPPPQSSENLLVISVGILV
jgi:hypothetical protein